MNKVIQYNNWKISYITYYAKEIIDRHNDIQFATKQFLINGFEVLNDGDADEEDDMNEGENVVLDSNGEERSAKRKVKAIVKVHCEKVMAKTILDNSKKNKNKKKSTQPADESVSELVDGEEEVLLEKVITDLSAEKNSDLFDLEPRTDNDKEKITDADPRYIHFDITVTHAASRSKVQSLKTHMGMKAAEKAEGKKVDKYFAARGNTQGFMDRFTPIAFESTGSMGPATKALFESNFAKFGLDEFGLKTYTSYYKWYVKRVNIICASYLFKVYERFRNDVICRASR